MSNYTDLLLAGAMKAINIDMMFLDCPAGKEYRDNPIFTRALLRSDYMTNR